ncbi:hypothetical protein A3I84_01515 [Candidatus Nomurabacteria bacterium RIFCSPLOWO2_02_FULL_36_8]|nr:MAG: hypothetical protein A3I84_01515 [Candidatus Nomurabacteria bacterium RIFCSPLOWO2_02_FULL_36_8]
MNQKNIVIVVVVIVMVVGFGFLISKKNMKTGYSVVYMTTGEVYIGKLSIFPDFTLTDSYQFQVVKDTIDANKNNFQLNPVKEALWAPESMYLVKNNIVFYGPISPESKIAQALSEKVK